MFVYWDFWQVPLFLRSDSIAIHADLYTRSYNGTSSYTWLVYVGPTASVCSQTSLTSIVTFTRLCTGRMLTTSYVMQGVQYTRLKLLFFFSGSQWQAYMHLKPNIQWVARLLGKIKKLIFHFCFFCTAGWTLWRIQSGRLELWSHPLCLACSKLLSHGVHAQSHGLGRISVRFSNHLEGCSAVAHFMCD